MCGIGPGPGCRRAYRHPARTAGAVDAGPGSAPPARPGDTAPAHPRDRRPAEVAGAETVALRLPAPWWMPGAAVVSGERHQRRAEYRVREDRARDRAGDLRGYGDRCLAQRDAGAADGGRSTTRRA